MLYVDAETLEEKELSSEELFALHSSTISTPITAPTIH